MASCKSPARMSLPSGVAAEDERQHGRRQRGRRAGEWHIPADRHRHRHPCFGSSPGGPVGTRSRTAQRSHSPLSAPRGSEVAAALPSNCGFPGASASGARMVWGAKAAWGAGAASSSDRARLPKGNEPCHICGEDSMVEVKVRSGCRRSDPPVPSPRLPAPRWAPSSNASNAGARGRAALSRLEPVPARPAAADDERCLQARPLAPTDALFAVLSPAPPACSSSPATTRFALRKEEELCHLLLRRQRQGLPPGCAPCCFARPSALLACCRRLYSLPCPPPCCSCCNTMRQNIVFKVRLCL